jgi:hypothetical protein
MTWKMKNIPNEHLDVTQMITSQMLAISSWLYITFEKSELKEIKYWPVCSRI